MIDESEIAKLRSIYYGHRYNNFARFEHEDYFDKWGGEFFAKIPSFYIEGLQCLNVLSGISEILVKDGILGTLRFFRMHPSPPKKFSTIFYMSKSLADIVPIAWKDSVKIVKEIYSSKSAERKKIILHGIINRRTIDFPSLKKKLDNIIRTDGIEELIVVIKSHSKGEGVPVDFFEAGFNEFLNCIYSIENVRISFQNLDEVCSTGLEDCYYVPIDHNNIHYSFLSSEVRLKGGGATPWKESSENKIDGDITISYYYGLRIIDIALGKRIDDIKKIEMLESCHVSVDDLTIACIVCN